MSAETLAEITDAARKNGIPVMQDTSAEFICAFIKSHKVHSVLEIGTAVACSAIQFAQCGNCVSVTTIEIDIDRVIQALQNVRKCGLENRIKVIHADALSCCIDEKFDLIFIDAAKAQYEKFFERFKRNLNPDGVVISDNLFFHGIVENESLTKSYSTRKLVRKIKKYVNFLRENTEFSTQFYNIGDGISVSRKKPSFLHFISSENLIFDGGFFQAFKAGDSGVLEIFKESADKDFALRVFRNFRSAYSSGIFFLEPAEFLKTEKGFGQLLRVQGNSFFHFSRMSESVSQNCLCDKFVSLHKKILNSSAENLAGYKEVLLLALGGNSKQNSSVIRKIKKLPDGNSFCHGNFSLETAWVDEHGICFSSGFFFSCRGPREFDVARTFFLLSKNQKNCPLIKPDEYLAKMEIDMELLKSFLELIELLENSVPCFFETSVNFLRLPLL
ncbi:O-methyltransferase [Treponema sp.]|uniref:O-methyltransferase n=1 Tax=Treponema sp. TaxID=166 RepID=UPI003F063A5C